MKPRVRIAPSPTGYFHFGLARTALYNYLFAKKEGGAVILRIEDTDKKRNQPEYLQDIYDSFEWLGISFDEKYVQSEHLERHKELLRTLVAEDKAYISKEIAKDDSGREVAVVRLRNPGTAITFTDAIRGDITFDTTELKDFVIARTIDDPLYHFAVVVDDGDAKITHVIRGDDHISNTPRQILIQEALGYPRPIYAHLPLILAPDRSKMSKRKHETALKDFRAKGYLPEALVNFTALLGWSPKTEQEVFNMQELIAAFAFEGIHKAGAIFDSEKLRWFNRQYLMMQSEDTFVDAIMTLMKTDLEERGVVWNAKKARAVVPLLRERISVYEDVHQLIADGELDFFFAHPELDMAKIPEKKSTAALAKVHLAHAEKIFDAIQEDVFDAAHLKDALWDYASEKGRGAVLWPLRYILSGRDKSPDPFMIAEIIGKRDTIDRIRSAHALL